MVRFGAQSGVKMRNGHEKWYFRARFYGCDPAARYGRRMRKLFRTSVKQVEDRFEFDSAVV